MSTRYVRKFQMNAIPREISETGGFSAQLLQDESGTVDANDEVLPGTIEKLGVKVGKDVAQVLTKQYFLDCVNYVARTGKTLVIGGVLVIRLSIRGSYKNKDSKVTPDKVHVSVFLLNEAKPVMTFTLSNANEGKTLVLYTATTPDCELKHVVQGAAVVINGQYTKILEGDKVTASMKVAGEEPVVAECPVVESDDSHIKLTLPAAFNAPSLVGHEIVFTVESRCGDPEAGTQTKSTAATLDKGDVPEPPTVDDVSTEGKDGVQKGQPFAATGSNLTWGEGSTAKAKWTQDGETKEQPLSPTATTATKLTFAAVDAFDDIPDGTVLTFEFAFADGQVASKNAELLAAE